MSVGGQVPLQEFVCQSIYWLWDIVPSLLSTALPSSFTFDYIPDLAFRILLSHDLDSCDHSWLGLAAWCFNAHRGWPCHLTLTLWQQFTNKLCWWNGFQIHLFQEVLGQFTVTTLSTDTQYLFEDQKLIVSFLMGRLPSVALWVTEACLDPWQDSLFKWWHNRLV